MASNREVRNLKEEEKEEHLDMLNLSYNHWGSKEQWQNKHIQPDFDVTKNIIVVEEGGKWLGGGTAWFRDALIGESRLKIYIPGDLYTLPEHAGKGVYSTAMKGLNQLGQENNAVFGVTCPSPPTLAFQALPRYGFCDVFRPKTKIKLLRPEKLLLLLEDEKIGVLQKLEGKRIKLVTPGEDILFEVKDSALRKTTEVRKPDIIIKSDLQTLFNIFASYQKGKMALVLSAIRAVFRRRLSLRMSLKNLVKVLFT